MPFELVDVGPGPVAGPAPAVPGSDLQDNAPVASLVESLPGVRASGVADRVAPVHLDLGLAETRDADGQPGGLRGMVTVAVDLFDEATARAVADGSAGAGCCC